MEENLITIPGVGKSLKEDLILLGYYNVSSLKKENPEEMYQKLCVLKNEKIDRCVLYVFRCAVSYASSRNQNLKWWDFKD